MGYYNRRHLPVIDNIDWNDRCADCECHSSIIPPDGPYPCKLYLLGERPGADEALRSTRPFSGKSGRELNENYLQLAGLHRDDVFVSNAVKCFHPTNKTPSKGLIKCCTEKFVSSELEAVQPTIIVPMGGTACSIFDGINLQLHHGMPLRRSLYGKQYLVVPQFHPALGLHDTRKMVPMLEDWERLSSIIEGEYQLPIDRYKNPDYRLVHGRSEVEAYLKPVIRPQWLTYGGLDTETDAGKLWCITVSIKPGTGIMILADDLEGLATFRELCDYYSWSIHNALFDLSKLSERDIHLRHVTCTMQAAYHRGNLPQGLKQLAWRLLGITMTEYEDVVVPQSKLKLLSWWQDALLALDADSITTERFHKKTGKPLKPTVTQTQLFKRMMFIYNKGTSGSETYDMWKVWDQLTDSKGIVEADKRHVIDCVGPPPRPSIIHVPMESSEGITGAKDYAVRDSDSVLRLGLHLRSQERQIRREMSMVVR